ncbi:MAG TPA: hypothetical protein VN088_08785 [Nocardioides sp.]|nr:hypothetical protein [Nocardioides sp.]
METRYRALIEALRTALYDGPGAVAAEVRRAAGSRADVPAAWAGYVDRVHDASYRIGDGDVAALRAAGHSEEEIFEVTVAAATGAALHRLRCGLRALRAES